MHSKLNEHKDHKSFACVLHVSRFLLFYLSSTLSSSFHVRKQALTRDRYSECVMCALGSRLLNMKDNRIFIVSHFSFILFANMCSCVAIILPWSIRFPSLAWVFLVNVRDLDVFFRFCIFLVCFFFSSVLIDISLLFNIFLRDILGSFLIFEMLT